MCIFFDIICMHHLVFIPQSVGCMKIMQQKNTVSTAKSQKGRTLVSKIVHQEMDLDDIRHIYNVRWLSSNKNRAQILFLALGGNKGIHVNLGLTLVKKGHITFHPNRFFFSASPHETCTVEQFTRMSEQLMRWFS